MVCAAAMCLAAIDSGSLVGRAVTALVPEAASWHFQNVNAFIGVWDAEECLGHKHGALQMTPPPARRPLHGPSSQRT